jgi:hypothetical protein
MYLKGTPMGNVSFYTSHNKKQNEILIKHAGIFSSSLFSMHETFLLAIFQDTCKSLCHEVFSGIFVTALLDVYFFVLPRFAQALQQIN